MKYYVVTITTESTDIEIMTVVPAIGTNYDELLHIAITEFQSTVEIFTSGKMTGYTREDSLAALKENGKAIWQSEDDIILVTLSSPQIETPINK